MTSSRMIFACGVVLLASCISGIPVEDADLTDKIVQNEATTGSEDSVVEIFTHSHQDEDLSTPEQKERASAELQELQTEQEARATDSGNCGWTRQYSCPGQQLGSWAPGAVQMPMALLATASAACMRDGDAHRRAIQLQNSIEP